VGRRPAGDGRAVFAGPGYVCGIAQFEQQMELLCKEQVVVFNLQAEEGEGFDEGAASDHHLCASPRDKVERGKVLKDSHVVCSAEDCVGDGDADLLCACGGEDEGGTESSYSLR
jgi:hypothetical protein